MAAPKKGMVNRRTGATIANQPFEAIPSLPGAFSKQKASKKGKSKQGGMSVR